jgi:hypothetical protein
MAIELTGVVFYSNRWQDLVLFFISIPISAQQCLVLLPLTSFNMSPVCGTLRVPAHSQDAACLYKWAIAGISIQKLIFHLPHFYSIDSNAYTKMIKC